MKNIYLGNYKKYLILPIIVSIFFLIVTLIYPGIPQGIDFTGGTIMIIHSENELSAPAIEQVLKNEFDLTELTVSTISSPTGHGAWIQYKTEPIISNAEAELVLAEQKLSNKEESIMHSNNVLEIFKKTPENFSNSKLALIAAQDALTEYKELSSEKMIAIISQKLNLGENIEYQKREVSPTLGSTFYSSGIWVALWSLTLVVFVIFLFFRKLVPSMAIILSGMFDILGALAGMALFGIPLSLVSIPALLMLIGYSVDTDIMLTHRLTKKTSQKPSERAIDSMKTGLTMTFTTLAALT
jgi:preprotein translocase subunit SecF